MISELQPPGGNVDERNQRALTRMLARLGQWEGVDPARKPAVVILRKHLAGTCAKRPANDAARVNCTQLRQAGCNCGRTSG